MVLYSIHSLSDVLNRVFRWGVYCTVSEDPPGAEAWGIRQDNPPPPGDPKRSSRDHVCKRGWYQVFFFLNLFTDWTFWEKRRVYYLCLQERERERKSKKPFIYISKINYLYIYIHTYILSSSIKEQEKETLTADMIYGSSLTLNMKGQVECIAFWDTMFFWQRWSSNTHSLALTSLAQCIPEAFTHLFISVATCTFSNFLHLMYKWKAIKNHTGAVVKCFVPIGAGCSNFLSAGPLRLGHFSWVVYVTQSPRWCCVLRFGLTTRIELEKRWFSCHQHICLMK